MVIRLTSAGSLSDKFRANSSYENVWPPLYVYSKLELKIFINWTDLTKLIPSHDMIGYMDYSKSLDEEKDQEMLQSLNYSWHHDLSY